MALNVSVVDNFNRANGAVGSNWTAEPMNDGAVGWTISSNRVVHNSQAYPHMWWNVGTESNASETIEVAATIVTMPASARYALVALIQQPSASSSTADGYRAEIHRGTSCKIIRYSNTTGTDIATGSDPGFADGDILILRLHPNGDLEMVKDTAGTESVVRSVNDTTFSGAFYGCLGAYDEANFQTVFDDFALGTFAAGGGGDPEHVPGSLALLGVGRSA